jgi:hypothetical protein
MNATPKSTQDLEAIEQRACDFRFARDQLRILAADANAEMERIKQKHLPLIREALSVVADNEAALREAIQDSSPDLWRKLRTRTFHGVRVGWIKQRGKVEIEDETKVIERIRKLLPAEQAELLIRTREAVHKPGVYDLTAADLKRLGIRIADDSDVVVIKDLASELDRAIEALLAQAARTSEETAEEPA